MDTRLWLQKETKLDISYTCIKGLACERCFGFAPKSNLAPEVDFLWVLVRGFVNFIQLNIELENVNLLPTFSNM